VLCISGLFLILVLLTFCATDRRFRRENSPSLSKTYHRSASHARSAHQLEGICSYYGPKFHGKRTASGEKFDMYQMTAAHKTLPFATRIKVINLDNGKSVIVKINDRGPFVEGRILDLSYAAAKK
jgi:rare lipoprotein A